MSDPITTIKWDYASREDELQAIRWYLAGRLGLQRKLDLRLGTAVNLYEYLRHAVKLPMPEHPGLPGLGKVLQVPMKAIGACEWIWPDRETGQWFEVPEFPRLPFTKLSDSSRKIVLSFLDAKHPAFSDMDITELDHWGVLKALSELAKASEDSKERVIAEVEVSPQISVIPFEVDFGAGVKEAERSFQCWIKENRHRFARDGRISAGARAKNNPCMQLKDLAAARLLYFHSFNVCQASKWTWEFQPRDSDGKIIPWFNNKRVVKTRSHVFKDPRNLIRALKRFEKDLGAFLVLQ